MNYDKSKNHSHKDNTRKRKKFHQHTRDEIELDETIETENKKHSKTGLFLGDMIEKERNK